MSLSQKLFDETVLENQEVFDLDNEEAVKETISQLSKSGPTGSSDLSHLVLSHPSADLEERQKRRDFIGNLESLQTFSDECGEPGLPAKSDFLASLRAIMEVLSSSTDPKPFLSMFESQGAISTLLRILTVERTPGEDTEYVDCIRGITVEILGLILTPLSLSSSFARAIQSRLKDKLRAGLERLVCFLEEYQTNDEMSNSILKLCCAACRNNEQNKKELMDVQVTASLLVSILKNGANPAPVCDLVAVLCTFDDFQQNKNGGPPLISSANDNVLQFGRVGILPVLCARADRLCDLGETSPVHMPQLTSVVRSLRSLAIHDDLIQSMVAIGILDITRKLFRIALLVHTDVSLVSSSMGLVRNLCANDELKTSLCKNGIMDCVLDTMRRFPGEGLVQEHGCGTLAAMALRNPRNSLSIISKGGPNLIVLAMKQDPSNFPLQRQGALAIRNLVCRLGDDATGTKEAILELGTEEVLRKAGEKQSCVDEAYAALRDLGCHVSRKTIQEDGTTFSSTSPMMFGDVKSSFRQVYDD